MIVLNITTEDLSPPIPGKTVKIVRFDGQMDSSNIEEKKKILDEIIVKNPKNLFFIFDFEKLTYMNSLAIGCLAECHQNVESGGGKILVARPTENILDLLKVVGIDKFITVYPSVEAAKAALLQ